MKYCSHCGAELLDEAVICPKCGCEVGERKEEVPAGPKNPNSQKGLNLLLVSIIMTLGATVAIFVLPILIILWLLVEVAAYVLFLVGLGKCGKDSKKFKLAFWLEIGVLIMSPVSLMLSGMGATAGVAIGGIILLVCTLAVSICQIFIYLGITKGCYEVTEEPSIKKIGIVIIVMYCLAIVVSLLETFNVLAAVMTYLDLGISIASAVLEIVLISKSKKLVK